MGRLRPLGTSIVLLAVASTLVGCASGTPAAAPFDQLSTSMQQVRTGADATLSAVYDRARDRYIAQAAEGDAEKVQALLLTRPQDDPFGWSTSKPPLFLTAARFREGVYRFNSVVIQYANALNQLAAKNLVDPKTFDQLATNLNGNVKSAVQAFGIAPSGNKETAIFSTAATAAFEAYLRHRQRSELVKALHDNQPAIQNVAELGAQAVRITALAVRNEYDTQSAALANAAASGSASARAGAMRDLADLDDSFVKEIGALRILHESYVALPRAHEELAASLENPGFSFAALRDLFQNGQDLYRRYEELTGKDKKTK